MRVGILAIGNELLSGKVTDLNATWLISELRRLGSEVARVAIIPDEASVIIDHVREYSDAFDTVITTGGVGPTHDDITFDCVAKAFGEDLQPHPDLAKAISAFFNDPEDAAGYLPMANVPASTELLWRPPLPFPITRVRNVFVMPGDPTVLKKKFAAVADLFAGEPFTLRRVFTRLGEGALAPMLRRIQQENDDVQIGSYPVYDNDEYEVQVTIESRDDAAVDRVFNEVLSNIADDMIWKTETS